MSWYLGALKKYAVFSGRARRTELLVFALISMLVTLLLQLAEHGLGWVDEEGMGPLSLVYSLFVVMPTLALAVRRLHDTGRSGWWMLIAFVPFVNIILVVIWLLNGEPDTNQFGPNPRDTVVFRR